MIDFPANPVVGETHSISGLYPASWRWDGAKWTAMTPSVGDSGSTIGISSGVTLPVGYNGEVLVDTSPGPITVMLPAAASISQEILIKDKTGHAAVNNLTIGGSGNLIEGQPTMVIAKNYGWARLLCDGAQWVQA